MLQARYQVLDTGGLLPQGPAEPGFTGNADCSIGPDRYDPTLNVMRWRVAPKFAAEETHRTQLPATDVPGWR